eukprot:TRINITY_DN6939_c0_g2_i1.p1 TRINITY_DN6939_c0_g2~~TRINITY_DN6939_c0_g2_i1.p1  ORF type:complete len:355 (-),score=120.07 TRINITY_DN6939_c0_g2_i1:30-1094(-)
MSVSSSSSTTKLHLNGTIVCGFEGKNGEEAPYVFEAKTNSNYIATSTSENVIKIYSSSSFEHLNTFHGHSSTINELNFFHSNPHLLFSASSDQNICLWDLRTNNPIKILNEKGNGFFSFSLNANDSMIASGIQEDILVWDIRTWNKVVQYSSFHPEDITQVKFHPIHHHLLYTGSMDGSICVTDTRISDEEEALTEGIHLEDSIQNIGFYGVQREKLWIQTHSERLSFYQEGIRIGEFDNPRLNLSNPQIEFNYLVSCTYDPSENQLYVAAGTHSGTIGLGLVNEQSMALIATMEGGHNGVLRSVQFDVGTKQVVSAGEDSRVCFWSDKESERASMNENKASKKRIARDLTKPY